MADHIWNFILLVPTSARPGPYYRSSTVIQVGNLKFLGHDAASDCQDSDASNPELWLTSSRWHLPITKAAESRPFVAVTGDLSIAQNIRVVSD